MWSTIFEIKELDGYMEVDDSKKKLRIQIRRNILATGFKTPRF